MRVNIKKLVQILIDRQLTPDDLASRTGLTSDSVKWILDGEDASIPALERVADAIGARLKDFTVPDRAGCNENVIDFLKDADTATLTLSQGKYKARIEKLSKSHPDECRIVARNRDGSMIAHIPVDWIRISPPKRFTEEQRAAMAEQLRQNCKKGSVLPTEFGANFNDN